MKAALSPPKSPPGRAPKGPGAFEMKDAYAVSPYGEGYGFVNNQHDQFGSTAGFNESKTSDMADPKPTAQMRVKSGYTGHVPKGRDHIGSTYRTHDNRGTAGKTMVPIPHKNIVRAFKRPHTRGGPTLRRSLARVHIHTFAFTLNPVRARHCSLAGPSE